LGRLTQNSEDRHYLYSLDGKYLAVNDFGGGLPFERTEYVYLDDMPIAQFKDSFSAGAVVDTVVTYIHTDHLTTPRALTDRVGNIVWRWEGDAFGIAQAEAGMDVDGNFSELALRFPGQISNGGDPFFYNMNRTYDSLLGRYTQSDPIGLNGGLNTYGYALQNPLKYIDPLGLQSIMACANPANAAVCAEAGIIGPKPVAIPGLGSVFAKPKPGSKPKDCPSGTIPIDQVPGLDKDDIHGIKDGVGAGPRDWTGIAPNGDVITGDHEGNAVNHGPKSIYLP
jgi:RHS repeat-associated protein